MRAVPFLLAGLAVAQPGYDYVRAGNPANAVAQTRFGLVLMGGGKDVEAAFRWMIERSSGGDFLTLRAAGTDAYNPFVLGLGKLNSAATLIMREREAASDPAVLDIVRNAEAIWIAGGNQANYVRLWRGTPLQDLLNGAAKRNVPLGGTSAGLAILGQFAYSAENGGISSAEAAADANHPKLTLTREFLTLPFLGGILTDSHFTERGRLGRLRAMLEKLRRDGWSAAPSGLGIDERTAVLIDAGGEAKVVGEGKAHLVQGTGVRSYGAGELVPLGR